jgi:nucleotide-binding universal stress UspA family protein
MPGSKRLRILLAIDDSSAAAAALDTVVKFPWPESARVRGVVALRTDYSRLQSNELDAAVERGLRDAADSARDMLGSRWSDAKVTVVNEAPLDAVLGEARRLHADVVALGWRGHGSFRRLLAGSMSRAVAARAESSVLIARTAPSAVRRFLVGYDADAYARRTMSLLSRLEPRRGTRAILVNVIQLIRLPPRAARLPTALRVRLRSDVAVLNAERREQAQAALADAAARLKSMGWAVDTEVRTGPPLIGLLSAARAHRADVLVLGARETRGLRRMLLGSVAEGALNNSRIPVLLVR